MGSPSGCRRLVSLKLGWCVVLLLVLLGQARGKLKGKHEKEELGVVLLDAVTFPKIVPHPSQSVLLLVHNAAADGDYGADSIRADFYQFAEKSQLQGTSDMILYAHVLVTESEPTNVQLAQSLGLATDFVHPKILLFLAGEVKPIEYPTKNQVNHIALSRWLSKQVDEYFLPTTGLIQSFAPLVARFMRTEDPAERTAIIAEATALAPTVELKDKENAKSYIKYMERITEKGASYVKSEIERMEELVGGEKISKMNKILLQRKVNILHSFDRTPLHDGSEL